MIFENIGQKRVCEVAEFVAAKIQKGDIILLEGDMGAGKTFFTRCLAKVLHGNEYEVASPTFTIVNLYHWQDFKVYHMDFYRLASCELGDIGVDEMLDDPKSLKIVEWPSNLGSWKEYGSIKEVSIEYQFDNKKKWTTRTYRLKGF